jgi:hypothetical protein
MPQRNYPKRIHLFGGIMLLICAVSVLALVIGKETPTKIYDGPVSYDNSVFAEIVPPVPDPTCSPVPLSSAVCPMCGSVAANEPLLNGSPMEFVTHNIAFVMFEETNTVQNAIGAPFQQDGAVLLANVSAEVASALLDTFGTMVNDTDKVGILTQPTVRSLLRTAATICCGSTAESFIIELRSYKSQDGNHVITDVVLTRNTLHGDKEESCRLELPTFSTDKTGLVSGSIGGKGFFLFVQTVAE